jgi:hypothetical protein
MADYSRWGEAAASAFGFQPKQLLVVLGEDRLASSYAAIEASTIGQPIVLFMQKLEDTEKREEYSGTVGDLLDELTVKTDPSITNTREWPRGRVRKFSDELRRISPNLRQIGIEVSFGKHTNRGTSITLQKIGKRSSRPSQPSKSSCDNDLNGDSLKTTPSPDRHDRHHSHGDRHREVTDANEV